MVGSVTSSEESGIRTGGRNQLYNLGKKKNNSHGSLLAPTWLKIYLPLVLLTTRLAKKPSKARIEQLRLKTVTVLLLNVQKSNDYKPAQHFPPLPFQPRGTQGSSLENWYFSKNSSRLSEHLLLLFQNMVSPGCVPLQSEINPFPHCSEIMKTNLGHIQTATIDKAKFIILLISGNS